MRVIGGQSGNQAREFRAVASGALPNGNPVIVNSDGTVEVVGLGPVAEDVGSPTVFESDACIEISAVYDSTAGKVVIAFQGSSSSNGAAIVGTVSGSSISFGSPTNFNTYGIRDISATYDSYYGTAIVGTVSGSSISFGSPTVFNSAFIDEMSATYDSTAGKVVIAFQDSGNFDYGTAIAGTVSGSSISFGSSTVFESAETNRISATYDSATGKVVIAYADNGNSNYGTAVTYSPAYTATNLTAENFVGFSSAAYGDAEPAVIQTGCSVNEAQSGLTAGQIYYVQGDGTLNTTPDTPSVEAGLALSSTKLLIKG